MCIAITNISQKTFLNESNHKPNKIWKDKSSGFYNRSVKSWLQDNYTQTYSTHIEGKSGLAERFLRPLK